MEDYDSVKEFSRQVVGPLWDERIRKQDMGTLRSPKSAGRRLDVRGSNNGAVGEKLAGGTTVQSFGCCARVMVRGWTVP